MNQDITLPILIIGSMLWILLMLFAEPIRNTYYRLKPKIKFVITSHTEGGQFEIIDNKHVPIGITLYVEGYFENEAETPSTVKAIEAQLMRQCGIFKLPISEKGSKAAYYLEGGRDLIDYRGCYVAEYSISPKVKADAACFFGNKFDIEKLGRDYFFKVTWRVLGQEPKETKIFPNWDGFKKDIKAWLLRPIP